MSEPITFTAYAKTDEKGIFNCKLPAGKPVLRTSEQKAPELERIAAAQRLAKNMLKSWLKGRLGGLE